MKDRPPIPKDVSDHLLVESRHKCNVCRKSAAIIHHIDKISSVEGNLPSNLIVLCLECHGRAELSSPMERKITTDQLRMYKKQWTDICRNFPTVSFEKPVLVYCFLNKPRISMLFNQLATSVDRTKVLDLENRIAETYRIERLPLERMMQTIIDYLEFINVYTILTLETLSNLKLLEGLPICGTSGFYSNGLRSPQYYKKQGIQKLPSLYSNHKIGDKTVKIEISYDPTYITSMTAYVELSGRHRLTFYGLPKRIRSYKRTTTLNILPLAIGLKQPIDPISAQCRRWQ